MNNEVLISGARIKITPQTIENGKVRLTNKSQQRAQFIVTLDVVSNSIRCYQTYGLNEVEVQGTHAYVILKTTTKNPLQTYEINDLREILVMTIGTPKVYMDTIEDLVLSTRDSKLIDQFYSAYGESGLNALENMAGEMYESANWRPAINQDFDIMTCPRLYKKGRRYSVFELVNDLVEDGAKILIDPELVGRYERITASSTRKPEGVEYIMNQLVPVTAIVGNKTRANLSLQYKALVSVDVPENEFGVEPGRREGLTCLKTINIIRDGRLNMPLLGVKVSSNLARRLRAVGCIEMNEAYDNLYLVNLKKIPIVCRNNVKAMPSYVLADAEARLYIAKVAQEYLTMMEAKAAEQNSQNRQHRTQVSSAEQFLRGIGIYGDHYYPTREIPVQSHGSYKTVELQSTMKGLFSDSTAITNALTDYVEHGQISRGGIKAENLIRILGYIKRTSKNKSYWEAIEKNSQNIIRENTFKLIASKTAKFADKYRPSAGQTTKKVELSGLTLKGVEISWRFKEINVRI